VAHQLPRCSLSTQRIGRQLTLLQLLPPYGSVPKDAFGLCPGCCALRPPGAQGHALEHRVAQAPPSLGPDPLTTLSGVNALALQSLQLQRSGRLAPGLLASFWEQALETTIRRRRPSAQCAANRHRPRTLFEGRITETPSPPSSSLERHSNRYHYFASLTCPSRNCCLHRCCSCCVPNHRRWSHPLLSKCRGQSHHRQPSTHRQLRCSSFSSTGLPGQEQA